MTGYSYDAADRVRTMTYPDGETVTTAYSARNLPLSLATSLGGQYISSATYDAQAHLDALNLGNGLQTDYQYYSPTQQGNRLSSLRVLSNTNPLLSLGYSYDPVGNVTTITDTLAAQAQILTFGYDPLDRLTAATAQGGSLPTYSHVYTYNQIGNLTYWRKDGQEWDYQYNDPAHPHAASLVDGKNRYTYDANGNMLTRLENSTAYSQTWTAENKLKQVTWLQEGQPYTTTFVYDSDGNRLLKIEQGSGVGGKHDGLHRPAL
ncbi:MAG: hypothetical protein DPW09_28980 [Anaerolineae bacterium]|nr:hypothetical protein [Anaerolineales bacterium]MCQ3977483.1 hypothetical protein [Anaerolineae bacterium]